MVTVDKHRAEMLKFKEESETLKHWGDKAKKIEEMEKEILVLKSDISGLREIYQIEEKLKSSEVCLMLTDVEYYTEKTKAEVKEIYPGIISKLMEQLKEMVNKYNYGR